MIRLAKRIKRDLMGVTSWRWGQASAFSEVVRAGRSAGVSMTMSSRQNVPASPLPCPPHKKRRLMGCGELAIVGTKHKGSLRSCQGMNLLKGYTWK